MPALEDMEDRRVLNRKKAMNRSQRTDAEERLRKQVRERLAMAGAHHVEISVTTGPIEPPESLIHVLEQFESIRARLEEKGLTADIDFE